MDRILGALFFLCLSVAASASAQAPELSIDVTSVDGPIDRSQLGTTLLSDLARRCVTRSAPRGSLRLRLVVAPNGRVSTLTVVDDGWGQPAARRCVERVVSHYRFPAHDGEGSTTILLSCFVQCEPDVLHADGLSGIGEGLRGADRGLWSSPRTSAAAARPQRIGVDPDAVVVRGALPLAVARRIVQRGLPRIRRCYERVLARHPELEGRIDLGILIDMNGRVVGADVERTNLVSVVRASIVDCVVREVRRWQFPPPGNGGVAGVRFPIVLRGAPPRTR